MSARYAVAGPSDDAAALPDRFGETDGADLDGLRKGRCPGVLRPMQSGDGLIARLKISCGIVSTQLAGRIADWSRRWGNGQIDLTGRGNLQLRGLSEDRLDALRDRLGEWHLLDDNAAGEAVRNVITSPLAGLDSAAVFDVRPFARALERRLSGDAALHGLPGKFGFAIDGGGQLGLDDVTVDIRFTAHARPDCPRFAIHLDGASEDWQHCCQPEALADVASALCLAFLDRRQGRENAILRMRDLVAADGAEAIVHAAGLGPLATEGGQMAGGPPVPVGLAPQSAVVILGLDPRAKPSTRHRQADPSDDTTGVGNAAAGSRRVTAGSTHESQAVLSVGLPFGRTTAENFARLATAAISVGATELRLTPWRCILVPVPSAQAAQVLRASLPDTAFIFDPNDPRRRVAACLGAPSCARATTPVRDHAAVLAAMVAGPPGSGVILHVSGCEKGCAHPRDAKVTLAAKGGRYHLIRDGRASDPPARRDLTFDQAAAQVRPILTPDAGE